MFFIKKKKLNFIVNIFILQISRFNNRQITLPHIRVKRNGYTEIVNDKGKNVTLDQIKINHQKKFTRSELAITKFEYLYIRLPL